MNMLANIWMPSGQDLAMLAPLWALIGTLVALLVGALIVGRSWRVSGAIATIGAIATGYLAMRGFRTLPSNWFGMSPAGGAPMLVADQFSYFVILLLSVFMILVTGMWWQAQKIDHPDMVARRHDATEFFILLVGSAFGMALMVSTSNLLMILLAVESASLPSYAITGYRKKNRLAAEASLKYVLFGAITSAIMIYGTSLLYGRYHTLDLATIGAAISKQSTDLGPSLLMGVSLFAFMIGVAFKISAVPFHFWCPDVFEGASIEVTTWLSVASKAAGIGLLLRIICVLTESVSSPNTLRYVFDAVAIMAAVTCTVGNLAAFRQINLKRLFAYSSIAHAGYMLMAAAVIWRPTDSESLPHPVFSAVVAYLAVYLLMNLGAFGVVAMVAWSTGRETIDAFSGLIRRNTVLAIVMIVCLFSLIGLPPFGGFVAKYFLLIALYEGDLKWLIFVAVFNTLISLYYYARIAKAMVFEDDGQPAVQAPMGGQAIVALCALGILLTGTFWAGGLKDFADRRSTGLYTVAPSSVSNSSITQQSSVKSPEQVVLDQPAQAGE